MNRDELTPSQCKICGGKVRLAGTQTGYMEPAIFAIYHCSDCEVAFPWPQTDASEVYDAIYANGRAVPGYHRYFKYADGVKQAKDPLGYLSKSEDVYWAVEQTISSARDPVLEVGSGLGYLTYALNRRGLSVLGLELSAIAVAEAKSRYGDYFIQGSVGGIALSREKQFRTVILTEVLEHILEPISFLAGIGNLMADDGIAVLTTPNKSAFPPDAVWASDCPPVHQWWFSEKAIKILATLNGFSAEFIDFSDYNRRNYIPIYNGYYWAGKVVARLKDDGAVRGEAIAAERNNIKKQVLQRLLLYSIVHKARSRFRGDYFVSHRRPTMGIVLRKLRT